MVKLIMIPMLSALMKGSESRFTPAHVEVPDFPARTPVYMPRTFQSSCYLKARIRSSSYKRTQYRILVRILASSPSKLANRSDNSPSCT